jgi:hypothetical protein
LTHNCSDGNKARMYKALKSYLYQCGEGDIPERPLYQQLELLKQRIGDEIISDLQEYKAAKWYIE